MSCRSSTASSPREYEENVRDTFACLKRAGTAAGLRGIDIGGGGVLVPVAEAHAGDAALIETLTRWREQSAFAFPTDVEVTTEGTARWLRMGLLDAEDRMLWLVTGRDGRPLGHMGFANALNERRELELDNVVRGEAEQPGIMGAALHVLTGWARDRLRPATISLRVLADNHHALSFYRERGWREELRIPLRRVDEGGCSYFEEAGYGHPADREFVKMVLPPTR
jgi:RimJ/RimL family protein N-acetyltransferase